MGSNTLLFLAGDGIGHEIAQETLKVIDAISDITQHKFYIDHDYIGGCSYDAYGTPCSDAVLNKARDADAVLLGCVGGYKWDNIPFEHKPERGLLRLRKELDLFANLRPALCFDALADSSSLKPDIISGLDIMIVRELTSGVYFGEPRGITGDTPHKIAVDTQRYTQSEIERVAHSAFDLARKRGKKVTSCEKANVMQTGILWREVVTQIHAKYYTDVELSHMYADNAAMQLVRNPKQFDVILTDNLFGDILSDVAAMLTGSLGMLPSASLGMMDKNNKIPALYEPVHGSAPDIAGQNKANPIAMILSFGMCLKYSLNMPTESAWISAAIEQVLAKNMRTPDIANNMSKVITTQEMGDLIADEIRHIAR